MFMIWGSVIGASGMMGDYRGRVYVWGENTNGQLGIWRGKTGIIQSPFTNSNKVEFFVNDKKFTFRDIITTPIRNKFLESQKVKFAAFGKRHSTVLCKTGVFSSGCSENGQLFLKNYYRVLQFKKADLGGLNHKEIQKIYCGQYTIFLVFSNKVYAGGTGKLLGVGSIDHVEVPKKVLLPRTKIKKIACGNTSTIFLTRQGRVFITGHKFYINFGNCLQCVPFELHYNDAIIDVSHCFKDYAFVTNKKTLYVGGVNKNVSLKTVYKGF